MKFLFLALLLFSEVGFSVVLRDIDSGSDESKTITTIGFDKAYTEAYKLKNEGIRTSIFIDPDISIVDAALETGTDRIELYTEKYAKAYHLDRENAITPYILAAEKANELGIGVNAGHDLNMKNLTYFAQNIPNLLEVSIGHALISESLYLGFKNVISKYLECLVN